MKIAILGTRGIPNNYGGFEQFAGYLAAGLLARGHKVYVYSTSDHPFHGKDYKGVQLIHRYNPERQIGAVGQFIYDLLCILDSRKRGYDIIYQLGYTSSSVWGWLLPRKSVIVTNMDGFEWKRSKYSSAVKGFLKVAERLAVKTSDHLVADSTGMQTYLETKYGKRPAFHPYGADIFSQPAPEILERFGLEPFGYGMLIARMEPENSIETILDGVAASASGSPFLVIGNHQNNFGRYLKRKFAGDNRIRFLDAGYEIEILNNLRYFSRIYFHGHTVGGTNPSLLEAMGSYALICAHDNEFNQAVAGEEAYYFRSAQDVRELIDKAVPHELRERFILLNAQKIRKNYLWAKIIEDYEDFFNEVRISK